MAKNRSVFVCASCGAEASKWQGQCAACGEWNTLKAFHEARPRGTGAGAAGGGDAPRAPVTLAAAGARPADRWSTGMDELDRVLGGGLVAGSVTLLGGDPGIGKSTLLLQAAAHLATQASVLYATGEESLQQVSERARRIERADAPLRLAAETSVERILEQAAVLAARVVVVDSIQTVSTEASESLPGSVSQVRESAARLVQHAKQTDTAILIIGHVTKEGAIAGPRVLEHMVDTVLYFESDAGSRFRIVRAVKNRFGAANEIGVFAMAEQGLREVRNPSAIFLSRHDSPVPGSVVTVAREGSRPMLLEVQALVDPSHANNPRRVALGVEGNRLAMLLAVLHRHGGLALHGHDVFLNVVGGVRVTETSADLAMLAAVVSSLRSVALAQDWLTFGEIGLAGEIRPVPYGEERLREAEKQGFTLAVVPRANVPRRNSDTLRVVGVTRLAEALEALRLVDGTPSR
jgi:DNA repair protein RadA/Sms